MRRYVHTVFLHCSASDHPEHDDPAVIRRWHLARGFRGVGYHYVITKDGSVHLTRSLERIPAAQRGFNSRSIAICLTGKHHFSDAQFDALRQLCRDTEAAAGRRLRFRGHCEVSSKICPVFDYKAVLDLDARGYLQP